MLQPMRGVLTSDPKITIVPGPDGQKFMAAEADVLYSDGRASSEPCFIHILAWNDVAEQLAQYGEGEEIQFAGRLNSNPRRNGAWQMSYTVKKIDDSLTLVAAAEKFLLEYEPTRLPSLSNQLGGATQRTEQNGTPQPQIPNIDHQ